MKEITNFVSDLNQPDKIIISAIVISLIVLAVLIIILIIKEGREKKFENKSYKETKLNPEAIEKIIVPEIEAVVRKEIITPVQIKTELPIEEPKKDLIAKMATRIENEIENPKTPVESYETSQEEESIISYHELIAKKKSLQKDKVSTNLKNIIDELGPKKVENISIFEAGVKEDKKEIEVTKEPSFKNAPFVSPVFGIQREEIDPSKKEVSIQSESIEKSPSLEETIDLEPISKQIKKSDNFLQSLKELRKNLD